MFMFLEIVPCKVSTQGFYSASLLNRRADTRQNMPARLNSCIDLRDEAMQSKVLGYEHRPGVGTT